MYHRDSDVIGTGHPAELDQFVLVLLRARIYEHHRNGAMVPRVDRLIHYMRMVGVFRLLAGYRFRKRLRLIAENNDNFPFYIHAGVVVIPKLTGGDAETRKYYRTCCLTRGGEVDRTIISIQTPRSGTLAFNKEAVLIPGHGAGRDGEILVVGPVLPYRLQRQLLELSSDVRRRTFQARCSGPASLHVRGGEDLKILKIPLLLGVLDAEGCCRKQ